MAIATNLGYPRIGPKRELKKAVEGFWAGTTNTSELEQQGALIRAQSWAQQAQAGLEHLPCFDFSLYDHILDHAVMFGLIPDRFCSQNLLDPYARYFAMARGIEQESGTVAAMEMTKWFNTNYHYIVPELSYQSNPVLNQTRIINEFTECQKSGSIARPVLIGPYTFLRLSKGLGTHSLALLNPLLEIYEQLINDLGSAGCTWIQMDEPCFGQGIEACDRKAIEGIYQRLSSIGPKILLTTYFASISEQLDLVAHLPVHGLHVDLVQAPECLADVLACLPEDRYLSAGVIDGRNIWRADLDQATFLLQQIVERRSHERIMVAPSCSLLHVPISLAGESQLDTEIKSWLAFADEKLLEIRALTDALNTGDTDTIDFEASRDAKAWRQSSKRIHLDRVHERLANLDRTQTQRGHSFSERSKQQKSLNLPLFPTTTIGSLPQTKDLRHQRSQWRQGKISQQQYSLMVQEKIRHCIDWQESLELDVLVHGEFERNDMVEYFGEQLAGFSFTSHGWVQSYGSRCVKPPIIFGDVERKAPMTVAWTLYAQSLTSKPVKGMLTGPVTILQWSFVRDDQDRAATCRQIALAIRDEVMDLEQAGIRVIQIDEPALREGLPVTPQRRAAYLDWAVECFRIASSGVDDLTQIHTHMCYSEFGDIMTAIAQLDADVVSIEASRSNMELLENFREQSYPNDIGPGIYDIHSPTIPNKDFMIAQLKLAAAVIDPRRLWVNPDCGLKTRRWEEVGPALGEMVAAAKELRAEHL